MLRGEYNATLTNRDEDGRADGDAHVYEEEGAWCMAASLEELREAIAYARRESLDRVEFYSPDNDDLYFIPLDVALVVEEQLSA